MPARHFRGLNARRDSLRRLRAAVEQLEIRRLLSAAVWDGAPDGGGSSPNPNWTTPSNWVGDVAPNPNDDLTFGPTGVQRVNLNDFPDNTTFRSITFSGPNYNVLDTSPGANSIQLTDGLSSTISAAAVVDSGTIFQLDIILLKSQTISASGVRDLFFQGDIDLNGFDLSFDVTNITLFSSGVISGNGSITKNGTGTLTLDADNSYTGLTTITDGLVRAANANALGSPGALDEVQTLKISGSASGNFTLTFAGGTTTSIAATADAQTIEDALNALPTIGGVGGSVDVTFTGSAFNITFGGTLAKTDVSAMTPSAVGGTTVNLTTLFNGNSGQRNEVQTVTITGSSSGNFALSFAGSTTGTLSATATAQNVQDQLNALPSIGGVGGSVGVTLAGNVYTVTFGGSLALTNVAQITASGSGGTSVSAATVADGIPPDAQQVTLVQNGGTLTLTSSLNIAEPLSIEGNGDNSGFTGSLVNQGGVTTFSGPVTVTGLTTIRANTAGGTLVFAGPILDAFTMTVDGPGRTAMNGKVSDIGGITKTGAGTLFVANANNDYTGNTTVSQGTIAGTGVVNALNFQAGGILAPGFSPGVFVVKGNLNLTSGTLNVELNGTTPGTLYDQVDVTGTVTLGGATLSLAPGFTPSNGDTFTIIKNDGTGDAVIGQFAQGTAISSGGKVYKINYAGGDGNDVVLSIGQPVFTWDGAPDGGGSSPNANWTTAANWVGDIAPVADADLIFGAAGAVQRATINDFPDNTTFRSITFNDVNYVVNEAAPGANTVQLTSGFSSNIASAGVADQGPVFKPGITLLNPQTFNATGVRSLTLEGPIDINGFLPDFNGTATVFVTGVISGRGGILKQGGGTLVLEGDNTYNGITNIQGGVVEARHDNALGSAGAINERQAVTISGATSGTFTLSFNGQTTNPLPAAATAQAVQDELNALPSIGPVGGSVAVTLSGSVYMVTFGGSLANSNVAAMTPLGSGGTSAGVSTTNDGNPGPRSEVQTVTITGSSSGTFTLTVNVSSTAPLPATATAQQVEDAINALPPLKDIGATVDVTLVGNVYTITFGGSLVNTPVQEIVSIGVGGTTATSATLIQGNDPGPNDGTGVGPGATLGLSGGIDISEELTIVGTGAGGTLGAIANISGNNSILAKVTLNGPSTIKSDSAGDTLSLNQVIKADPVLTVDGSSNTVLSAIISGNSASIVKNGTGTLLIANPANNLTGQSVANAGVLGGIGKVGPLQVTGTATLSPGSSPGAFVSGTFQIDSTLAIDLDGTTAGTQYDQVKVTGAATIDNATLDVNLGFIPANGDIFTIVTATGGVSGTFAGLPDGARLAVDGQTFLINYTSTTVTLTAEGAAALISDLHLTLSASPNPVAAGATLVYTATLENLGEDPAANVVVRMFVPANTTTVSYGGPGFNNFVQPDGSFTSFRSSFSPADGVATFTLTVTVNAGTPDGTIIHNKVEVRTDTAEATATDNVAETDTTVATPVFLDFGDAPDTYGTLLGSNGARHNPTGPTLGTSRDSELDGQPNSTATGDDNIETADEDGVVIDNPFVPGVINRVQITIAGDDALLEGYFDWNADGDFDDAGELVINSSGTGILVFPVAAPADAVVDNTFARFRVQSNVGTPTKSPVGLEPDGEVEDYQISIDNKQDFGDAPDTYKTTLASDGARHVPIGIMLGTDRDKEVTGQPNATATGDDAAGSDDEDGVTFTESIKPGQLVHVQVFVTSPDTSSGRLQSFFDWNADGDFADAGEKISDNVTVTPGVNVLSINVPSDAVIGTTFARFRISSNELANTDFSGQAGDGEVEDYQITIATPTPPTFTISGTKYKDRLNDGVTADDTTLGGVTIKLFMDVDHDNLLSAGDGAAVASTSTDAGTGAYSFTGLAPGDYIVAEDVPAGYVQSAPTTDGGVNNAEITTSDILGLNFANFLLPVPPTGFSIGDVTRNEGSNNGTTSFVFTITRTGDVSQPASVLASTADDTAIASGDYASFSNRKISFAANQASRTVTVNVVADKNVELDETFFVNLSQATGAAIVDGQGLGTIVNDDVPIPPSAAVLGPDPGAPGKTALIITGTDNGEFIDTGVSGSMFRVQIDGVLIGQFNLNTFSRIIIDARGGDDLVAVTTHTTKPSLVLGGEGRDTLKGGYGNDILLGGIGNDIIDGRRARDFIIGGEDADNLAGGDDDDLLVAAATNFDDDFVALTAIQKEWTSSNSYSKRTSNIRNGTGSNVGGRKLNNTSILEDTAFDQLRGNGGTDLFFYHKTKTAGNVADKLLDKSSSETAVDSN